MSLHHIYLHTHKIIPNVVKGLIQPPSKGHTVSAVLALCNLCLCCSRASFLDHITAASGTQWQP